MLSSENLQSNPAVSGSMMVGTYRMIRSGWLSGLNDIEVCNFSSHLLSDQLQTHSDFSHACQGRPICEILLVY